MVNLSLIMLAIISFVGLFIGYLLYTLTKEEKKQLERFLILTEFGTYLIIALTIFLAFGTELLFTIFGIAIIGITLFFVKIKSYIIFPLLGIITYAIHNISNVLTAVTLLVFISGMVTGTLYSYNNERKSMRKVLFELFYLHVSYLIVIIGMVLIF